MSNPPPPTVSIVLDWETGGECEKGRAQRCVAEINRQVHALAAEAGAAPELILVRGVDEPEPTLPELSWPGRFEIVAAPAGHDYYQKKNFGFAATSGAIVVFVDSDLAPEPDWLTAMLAPFSDPGKLAVVGLTHFETRTLYERAMALFWIFEPRQPGAAVRPTRRLVSNNIAFRRGLFAATRFPDRPTYRGQCSELGATLARFGVTLWEATAARAAHPPPAGAAGFLRRAWRAGHDAAWYERASGSPGNGFARRSWRADREAVRRRIDGRASAVGARRADAAAARGLGFLYYSVKALSCALLCARAPKTAPRTGLSAGQA